jgi:FKBP-type peptidyl-prolyl cis-trans isomerase
VISILLFLLFAVPSISLANTSDVTTIPSTAKRTASGISYVVLQEGSGERPGSNSLVTVHYSGWTMDGKMFDSSYNRGQTTTFKLTDVIEGWIEGVQLMQRGSKVRFWIPENLAYKGRSGAPAGMLVFDIELINFTDPPKAPSPLLPPQNAKKTSVNKPYVVDSTSNGPKATTVSTVTVHYNIWTTTGQLMQSTQQQNAPVTMPLTDMQKEWQEVLVLMAAGDRVSLWQIPEQSSYSNHQSNPALLHEIILVEVK